MKKRHTLNKKSDPQIIKQAQLRIIGGQWRSRKLTFSTVDGLRPTPDRVRETLFNWLQPYVYGAQCLDLFSGSGALGLEALSRGAKYVHFVEQQPVVAAQIETNLKLLSCQQAQVFQAEVTAWLNARQFADNPAYDLIFMDPPFNKDRVIPCCQQLEESSLIKDNTLIYIETELNLKLNKLPSSWQIYREKIAGQVKYQIYSKGVTTKY